MADSTFSLNKVLGWLKGFLSNMSSPIQGFDLQDAKVKQDGDIFSSLFTLEAGDELKNRDGSALTDIGGNPIPLHVLLKVINFKSVFNPVLTGLNKLNPLDAANSKNELLNMLLGEGRCTETAGVISADNTLKGAMDRKSGLLGVAIEDKTNGLIKDLGTFAGKSWDWGKTIAGEYLKYSLECSIPDKDYGAIDNVPLSSVRKLISEYLVNSKTITNEAEVNIDADILLIPLLVRMQATLRDYYNAAYKKYLAQDPEENTDNSTEEPAQDEANQENTQNTEEQDVNDISEDLADQVANTFTSKHIDVTLQRIAGTTEFNMTAIKANYDPSLVLVDMDEIVGQPEFIEALAEEPTTYAIDVDDDGFDIEPCEECMECNPCESLCEVFKAGIRAYRNLYILHWMSSGNDMMKLHNLSEEMYEELQGEIDTIGELLVEKQGTVPQLDFACDYIPVQQYDFQTGLGQIKSLIQMYIDCIDYAYCNQDSDVQSTLDEWLRHWNKQLNYFVKGQEI